MRKNRFFFCFFPLFCFGMWYNKGRNNRKGLQRMRILALGDIVGSVTVGYLEKTLWSFRDGNKIDFVIANGENAAEIRGINAAEAGRLFAAGVDALTLGNHAFGQKDLIPLLESDPRIIRPANYPAAAPGAGYTVLNLSGWRILCINLCGRAFMDAFADPFETVEKILAREAGRYDLSVLDFHAEATSEKWALARAFDGKIDVMYGTHTHVTTADEQILPGGSRWQTDLGMSGPTGGVIGTDSAAVINRFRTLLPGRFAVADGPVEIHGTVFDLPDGAPRRVVF